jgi:hypothetical protein
MSISIVHDGLVLWAFRFDPLQVLQVHTSGWFFVFSIGSKKSNKDKFVCGSDENFKDCEFVILVFFCLLGFSCAYAFLYPII